MDNGISVVTERARAFMERSLASGLCGLIVVLGMLALESPAAWAVGLTVKTCLNGHTAYICKGDILVADANAGPSNLGRILLIDSVSGTQTIVSEGNPFL